MAAHMLDSILFADQFGTAEMRNIFDDENLIQKWLDVEVALAKAEAELGIIPKEAAEEIARKGKVAFLDLAEMKRQVEVTGHPIVPLIRVFRDACAGDAGEYIHWGATTQDIMDTAVILQLKEAYELIEKQLTEVHRAASLLAQKYRDVPMPGRTHGQHALPITFGYKVAIWVGEMGRHLERLRESRKRVLVGNFAGAVGTLASLGYQGLEVQRLMMKELGLEVPDVAWHVSRDRIAEFLCVVGLIASTLGKIANEIINLQKTELGEVEEPFVIGKVGSSTMPHKRNPMICENIVALTRIIRAQVPLALETAYHQEHERDMSSWQAEWEFLPEVCILLSAALKYSEHVLRNLTVYPAKMYENLNISGGLIMSEAVMLRLAREIGRQKAHDLIYQITMECFEKGIALVEGLCSHPVVGQLLSRDEVEHLLDPVNYTGLSAYFVDRITKAHEV
ncbi:adenylosuccinate lyase [Calderihabitans maritimus]|uniref:Adenylosuccinate lyase n=1 Tax=Calderihabitans maritimus TaxID=1246530 RepID=A0A1Z5HU49_9FIRM|nr:adenylosuccinate lyase [Calderihabitans maritimus]GAW92810.1 adenylosuccinate lyase [Calderihabitans maritimus]